MNAWDVIGYSFDGALYCPNHVPSSQETGCVCGRVDGYGACESNCHGYGPHPVFASDELAEGDACDVDGCGYLDGCEPAESENES